MSGLCNKGMGGGEMKEKERDSGLLLSLCVQKKMSERRNLLTGGWHNTTERVCLVLNKWEGGGSNPDGREMFKQHTSYHCYTGREMMKHC